MCRANESGQNIALIYEYFLHRVYDQDFLHPSNTNDKEGLFIPTGYDSLNLIVEFYRGILDSDRYRNMDGEELDYQDAI